MEWNNTERDREIDRFSCFRDFRDFCFRVFVVMYSNFPKTTEKHKKPK